jgi:hypothetical protein
MGIRKYLINTILYHATIPAFFWDFLTLKNTPGISTHSLSNQGNHKQ